MKGATAVAMLLASWLFVVGTAVQAWHHEPGFVFLVVGACACAAGAACFAAGAAWERRR